MGPVIDQKPRDNTDAQRRVVRVLAASQLLGGIGPAAGAAVGALLAADLATESLSGLSASASVIGTALIAVPMSRLMDERGRRPGLVLAYLIGVAGAMIVILGAIAGSFPLALAGVVLTGGGTAAGSQSRFAATDLATPGSRGRSLSTVVWATTLGSVVGPNLASPMGDLAAAVGVPRLAGPYLLMALVFILAALIIGVLLRPDPLLLARDVGQRTVVSTPRGSGSIAHSLSVIRDYPAAMLGLLSIVVGHVVMVGVMSMTPVHLQDHGASLTIVGVVISVHITGMYVASPLVGAASDRYGRRPVMRVGALVLLAACAFAGSAPGDAHTQLGIGLILLGLGWSCTLIAGSTLLTESIPLHQRPRAQGASDLVMGMAGAVSGLLSGVVVGFGSYALLTIFAAILIVPLVVGTFRLMPVRAPA